MKKVIRIISTIFILVIIIFSIYMYINHLRNSAFAKIEINGKEIFLIDENKSGSEDENTDENKEQEIDLTMLDSKNTITIKIKLKNAKIKINGKEIRKSGEISIEPLEISKENKIDIEAKKIGDFKYLQYKINTLPSGFPEYMAEGTSEEGEYYLSTYLKNSRKDKHYIYKLNNKGQVTFYKETEDVAFNFKKNEIDGKIRYTYLEQTGERYQGITTSVPARLIVLDENYNQIKKIEYLTEDGETNTENHDYIYFDDNHYIVGGYTEEEVTNIPNLQGEKVKVWNCRLQEVKDGKILWEFQSINNVNLYEYYNEDNIKIDSSKPYINYMHFNSMCIDTEDGNLVCSFRNIDAIIKISRTTGDIIWILGGKGDQFGLTDDQKFSKQHSISFLSNHSIILYDNAYDNQNTRILIIKLDEKNKKIEEYKSYEIDAYIPRMGAVQAIDEKENIYLVTYGIGNGEYAFKELNLETMEAKFKFKLVGSNVLYRVNKY